MRFCLKHAKIVAILLGGMVLLLGDRTAQADGYGEVCEEAWEQDYTERTRNMMRVLAVDYCIEIGEYPWRRKRLDASIRTMQLYVVNCFYDKILEDRRDGLSGTFMYPIIGRFCERVWAARHLGSIDRKFDAVYRTEVLVAVICELYERRYQDRDDPFWLKLLEATTEIDAVYAAEMQQVRTTCHEMQRGRIDAKDARFRISNAIREADRTAEGKIYEAFWKAIPEVLNSAMKLLPGK